MGRLGWFSVVVGLVACHGGKPDGDDTDDTVAAGDTDVVSDTDAADTDAPDTDVADTDVVVDEDQDGSAAVDDCNDADPAVFPDAPERCNGIDDDCDPATSDDRAATWVGDDGSERVLDAEWALGPVTLDTPGTVFLCTGEFVVDTTITADQQFVGLGRRDDAANTGSAVRPPDDGPAIVVSSGAALTLKSLTLSATTLQGGVQCDHADVTLDDVTVVGFDQPALSADTCGVSLDTVTVRDNAVVDGVITLTHGTFTAVDLFASSNHGEGAAVLSLTDLDEAASILSSEVRENESGTGAIRLIRADAMISGVNLYDNVATRGASLNAESSDVMLTDSEVTGCMADHGGAISITGGSLVLTGTLLLGNTGTLQGGALWAQDAAVTLQDASSVDGNVSADGGGVYGDGLTLTLTGAELLNNVVTGSGGALFLTGGSAVTATDTTGDTNQASGAGAFLFASGSSFDFDHVSLHDNTGGDGGAVRVTVEHGEAVTSTWSAGGIWDTIGSGNGGAINAEVSDGSLTLDVHATSFSGNTSNLYGSILLRTIGANASLDATFTGASFLGTADRSISLVGTVGLTASGTGCDFPDLPLADLQLVDADVGFDLGLAQSFTCDASGCTFP